MRHGRGLAEGLAGPPLGVTAGREGRCGARAGAGLGPGLAPRRLLPDARAPPSRAPPLGAPRARSARRGAAAGRCRVGVRPVPRVPAAAQGAEAGGRCWRGAGRGREAARGGPAAPFGP